MTGGSSTSLAARANSAIWTRGHPAYCISKAALNAATCHLAAALRDRGIAVNCVCPGWVRTEMGGPNAPRTVEQSAHTIVWVATDAPRDLTGQLLRNLDA